MYEFRNYVPSDAQAQEATPLSKEDVKLLAAKATQHMDKMDQVRPSQAAAYAEKLGAHPFGPGGLLEGVSLEDAEAYASKTKAAPEEIAKRCKEAMADMKPSYVWLKAFIATAIVLEHPEAIGVRGPLTVPEETKEAVQQDPAPAEDVEQAEEAKQEADAAPAAE